MTFTEYCTANNIKLQKEDLRFVKRMIKGVPKDKASVLINEYVRVWIEAIDQESSEVKKQNRGRFAANTWLRTEGQSFREKPLVDPGLPIVSGDTLNQIKNRG